MNKLTPNTAARELAKIGELIRTQDNRIADQPIFIVQQRSRIYGLDDGHAEGHVWHYDGAESSYDDAAKAKRDAERAEDGSPPLEWDQVGYIDTWEFVTACFTEHGCKDYIAINGHNLREPRIYAEGSFRNNEWRTVRGYLSAITPSPECTCPSGDGSLRWPCPTHPPITQQQGGEQEAGDVERLTYRLPAWIDPRILPSCECWAALGANKNCPYCTNASRAYDAIAAALSKQPAASEGDVDWAKFPYSDAWCDGLSATLWECGMPNAQRQVEGIKDFVRVARANTSKQAAGEAVTGPYTLSDPNAGMQQAGYRPASVLGPDGKQLFNVSIKGEPELARFVVAAMNAYTAPPRHHADEEAKNA